MFGKKKKWSNGCYALRRKIRKATNFPLLFIRCFYNAVWSIFDWSFQ